MKQFVGVGFFWFRRSLAVCLMVFLLPSLLQAAAEQAQADTKSGTGEQFYVTTHLQTGLHTKASMDSPVIKRVSGGDRVVILETAGEFSKVQLKDGTKGWLYSQFIIPEKPAEVRVVELENQLQDLQEQLQATSVNPDASDNTAEAALQRQVNEYQATIARLQEELKAWEQLDFQDRQAQQNYANQINHELKQRLSEIAALATGEDAQSITIKVDDKLLQQDATDTSIKSLLTKQYLLIIVIGGVGFFLGILIMDMINRRRHGGYRI